MGISRKMKLNAFLNLWKKTLLWKAFTWVFFFCFLLFLFSIFQNDEHTKVPGYKYRNEISTESFECLYEVLISNSTLSSIRFGFIILIFFFFSFFLNWDKKRHMWFWRRRHEIYCSGFERKCYFEWAFFEFESNFLIISSH